MHYFSSPGWSFAVGHACTRITDLRCEAGIRGRAANRPLVDVRSSARSNYCGHVQKTIFLIFISSCDTEAVFHSPAVNTVVQTDLGLTITGPSFQKYRHC
jgi:hypothetical protein